MFGNSKRIKELEEDIKNIKLRQNSQINLNREVLMVLEELGYDIKATVKGYPDHHAFYTGYTCKRDKKAVMGVLRLRIKFNSLVKHLGLEFHTESAKEAVTALREIKEEEIAK